LGKFTYPRVTWLLCTNRDDSLLHRAINSCLNQTVRDFELLIVVNGANVEKLVRQLTQVYANNHRVQIIGTPISFLNFSLSLGLHLAKAPFVARMDADDVSHPDRLAQQLEFMEKHPDVVVLGSSYQLIDQDGAIHGQINLPQTNDKIRKALKFSNPICHPTVMLRRSSILSIGGYLGGKYAEDYDLWLRIATHTKWHFANLAAPLVSYNVAPNGLARRSREAYANVAGAQLKQFLVTRDIRWLAGAAVTSIKSFLRSTRR